MNATRSGSAWAMRAERIGQLRMAAALDDQPDAAVEQPGRGVGQQVEALLRVEPADHPDHRARIVGIEPDPGQQVPPAGRLAGPIGARIGRRRVRVGGRIPDRGVQPVEDAHEAVALGAQRAVEAHPEGRRERLGGEARRDGVDELGPVDPREQQVDAVGVGLDDPVAERQPELAERRSRRPAVIGEVVQGHEHRRVTDRRVARIADVAVDGGGAGVPVVQVQDVDRPAVRTERLERRAAEQPEAPRVVRVVAVRVPVEPVAIEGRRMIDQAQPVAVGRHVEDGHRAAPRSRPRIRHAQDRRPLDGRAARARPGSAAGTPRPAAPRHRRRAGRARAPGRRPRPPGRRSWPTARTRRRASRRATAWPASYAAGAGRRTAPRRPLAGAN